MLRDPGPWGWLGGAEVPTPPARAAGRSGCRLLSKHEPGAGQARSKGRPGRVRAVGPRLLRADPPSEAPRRVTAVAPRCALRCLGRAGLGRALAGVSTSHPGVRYWAAREEATRR